MLNHRDIIKKILSFRPDLTENDLQSIIQKKRERAGYLLTEEGAIYLLANELGIDLSNGRVVKTEVRIRDLIVGANDATVIGRITTISPIKSFRRKDGVEGKVARLVISDETGKISVVLWNEKTSVVSQGRISHNKVIQISHGYVRKGLNGYPELNVGRRGLITILSTSLHNMKKTIVDFKKISDLSEEGSFVNIKGLVKGISPISSFKKTNNRLGQVMRVRLIDGTGRIRAVFWDEKVEYIKKIRKGDVLKIEEGQIRKGISSSLEIHVGQFSYVELVKDPELTKSLSLIFTKIDDLFAGIHDVDVLGRVVSKGQVREFERQSGKVGKVGNMLLMDETGYVRLTLWNNNVDILDAVSLEDVVLVEGGYTREGLNGEVELHLGSIGTITLNPEVEKAKTLPKPLSNHIPISQLKVGMSNITVEGSIIGEPVIRDVTSRDGADLRVASLRIQDDTGEISVSLWRDLVNTVNGLKDASILRIKDAYVRMGFFGELELSSGMTTKVEVL